MSWTDHPELSHLVENLRAPSGGLPEAFALAQHGSASLPALLELATDADVRVRGLGCFALGALGIATPEVFASLQARLVDHDYQVRFCAVRALGALKTVPPELADRVEVMRRSDASPEVREAAGETLLAIGSASAAPLRSVEQLLQALRSEDQLVREEALGDLGRLGITGDEAVRRDEVLRAVVDRLLRDHEHQNRASSALALWRIGEAPELVISALTMALDDADLVVQAVACQVLGNFGPAAKPAVRRLKRLAKSATSSLAAVAQSAIDRITIVHHSE
jgi:HEAT repeat protein